MSALSRTALVALGGGAAAAILGAGVYKYASSRRAKKAKKKRKASYSRARRRLRRAKGRRYTPHTAGKGKDTSHRRIRYTRNGQPYIILASGKARFIKKKGARRSHKRPGGRY